MRNGTRETKVYEDTGMHECLIAVTFAYHMKGVGHDIVIEMVM